MPHRPRPVIAHLLDRIRRRVWHACFIRKYYLEVAKVPTLVVDAEMHSALVIAKLERCERADPVHLEVKAAELAAVPALSRCEAVLLDH